MIVSRVQDEALSGIDSEEPEMVWTGHMLKKAIPVIHVADATAAFVCMTTGNPSRCAFTIGDARKPGFR